LAQYTKRSRIRSITFLLRPLHVPRETQLVHPRPSPYIVPPPSPRSQQEFSAEMAQIIVIANQKGGVGKTTTSVNLSASLAVAEQRTLLVDGDPQANATSGVGVQPEQIRESIYNVLLGEVSVQEAVVKGVGFRTLDVLAATPDLAGAEV